MPVITVNNVSKRFRKGQTGYHTLREDIYNLTGRLISLGGDKRRDRDAEHILALRDVSFQIEPGERVGIIGRNGSGKTTLLRVLAGITRPTRGKISIKGRMGVLIELMAGFHPELTGRENIYLNGAIMGMSKKEIKRKFDEIVSFAELEGFIDTPIKRYSSGMHIRLGFAVSAHLEPDILLVDEVLAVGDAAFQKKCLGKMGSVAAEGRTVLFVSHNMPSVINLCRRTLWLHNGRVKLDGNTSDVVSAYIEEGAILKGERVWQDIAESPGNNMFRLRAVRVTDTEGNIKATVDIQKPFRVEIEYQIIQKLPPIRVAFILSTSVGQDVFTSTDIADPSWADRPRLPGRYKSICTIPGNLLNSGNHVLHVGADIPYIEVLFACDSVLTFEVIETGGVSGRFPGKWRGVVCPQLPWSVFQLDGV
jgi:lipopolysaccharide transport system ATP-binding protein